jgi:REP element-mobilizing transposase RayT
MLPDEIVTRRYLPHWYKAGCAHFITYRLVDSIPTALLREWKAEREEVIRQTRSLPITVQAERRLDAHRQFFKQYDGFLDRRSETKWLADARVATAVRENLYHHHGSKYELLAYCVMPNHVHVLMQPFHKDASEPQVGHAASLPADSEAIISDEYLDSKGPLAAIMHSLKSYTANKANEALGRTGIFWQGESYDHWVRDLDELSRIINYIKANPVRVGLCEKPSDWNFSSAHDRFHEDGSDCALVGWLRDDWNR